MINKRELELLYGRVEAVADAKYDGHGTLDEITLYSDGDFNVTYEIDSHCGCCTNEIDYIDVSFEEATGNYKEVVKQYEIKKLKAKEDAEKYKEEQKLKEVKAKETKELAEFNRLSKKFKK